MTIFEIAKANSTIDTGTFFEHIQNPAGGGQLIYTPIQEFKINVAEDAIAADLQTDTIGADVYESAMSINIEEATVTADLNSEQMEINNGSC